MFFRVQSKEAETGLAEDLSLIHMALTTNRSKKKLVDQVNMAFRIYLTHLFIGIYELTVNRFVLLCLPELWQSM